MVPQFHLVNFWNQKRYNQTFTVLSKTCWSSSLLTFQRDTDRHWRRPLPVPAPGAADLVGDVIPGFTEEIDGAFQGETSAWRWLTAETSMFWHQGVAAVPLSAYGGNTARR